MLGGGGNIPIGRYTSRGRVWRVPDFETEAKSNKSLSTFERISSLDLSRRSGTKNIFLALAGQSPKV